MPNRLHAADHVVIIGYFALLTLIGLYFWRRVRHTGDLFTGDRRVPWWLAGVSFYLTGFSAFSFVAYSEMAYRYGLVAMTLAWSAAAAMLVGTIALGGRWQRARVISPVQFLEARYSPAIRQVLAWAGIPLKVIDDGLKIYATGLFVAVGLGYPLEASIIVCGLVMLLYTFMGGLWAVIVTDYVQFIVLTLGVIVLCPLVLTAAGGPGGLGRGAPPGFLDPVSAPFSPLYVIAFYLLILLSYNGNWAYAQKFYCVPDERQARKAGYLAVALKLLGPPLFIIPAMAARSLMPELLEPPNSPQYTYALLALRYLPDGLVGLMIAAMFSATMSTLSGDYNVMASVVTEDLYRRLVNPAATDRTLVLIGRLATLGIGLVTIGIGVALVTTAKRGLFEVMVTVFGLFVGPMLIPMLAGLLTRRVTWRGAAAGIGAGFTSGLGLYLYKTFVLSGRPGIDPNWLRYDYEAVSILVSMGSTIAAMALVTAKERVSAAERAQIAEFFDRLSRPIERPIDGRVLSPFGIIAAVTAGTGLLLVVASGVQTFGTARLINVGAGGALCALAGGLYRLHRRMLRRTFEPAGEAS